MKITKGEDGRYRAIDEEGSVFAVLGKSVDEARFFGTEVQWNLQYDVEDWEEERTKARAAYDKAIQRLDRARVAQRLFAQAFDAFLKGQGVSNA